MYATPQALAELRLAWPFREHRWPPPIRSGNEPMRKAEAAAYARLALRGQRRSLIAGQALGVIGGAWLGAGLPTTWQFSRDVDGIDITSMEFCQLFVLVMLIEVSLLISDHSNDYEAVRSIYLRHAYRADGDAPVMTTPHTSRWARFRNWLRSRASVLPQRRPSRREDASISGSGQGLELPQQRCAHLRTGRRRSRDG